MPWPPVSLPELPALAGLPALDAALRQQRRAVFAAPPGSGKTTVLPLALATAPWLGGQKILLLEPRRVAARAAAARLATLINEKPGGHVGYQVRFERVVGPETRIEVLTEGLLTRRLQADPELPGVGLVIFDEFHERSLEADLALALTLEAGATLREDLRVLVMSATLDAERVAGLLGVDGVPAPVVEAHGRLHPVDVHYRAAPPADAPHGAAVARLVAEAWAATPGDVLAFLPGAREIRDASAALAARLPAARLRPLYGDLPPAEQDAALRAEPDGARRVVLATNIAQTSLTVEGVTAVVDGGLVRATRYDLAAGADRLETVRVSRASAEQRAGRAGRLGPGAAWRLWSADAQGHLPPHDTPEILRADVTRLALELAVWGVAEPRAMAFLDPPPPAAWAAARALLGELGAVAADGRITPHGRRMARLPAAPRFAHMLLTAGPAGLAETAAWVAAALDGGRGADELDLGRLIGRLKSDRHTFAGRAAAETVRQLVRGADARAPASPPFSSGVALDDPDTALAACVLWAFPERLAKRRGAAPGVFLCADGREARVPEAHPLARAEWLAIAHLDPASRRVRLAVGLDEATALALAGARVQERAETHWNPREDAVAAERVQRLGAIVLARHPLPRDSAAAREAVSAAFREGLASLGVEALPWTDGARQWQARVESLRQWRPDEAWPDVSDAGLAARLLARDAGWPGAFVDGMSRRAHLAAMDLGGALGQLLTPEQQRRLPRLAPTHVAVPSGRTLALAYTPDGAPPVLEVKLQELFGTTGTPTVSDGRVRVMLHLLSPGHKPIQVTDDLAGFWVRTYAEVKKELKGRYPRHPWPDDPLAASATHRAKPRGT